MTATARIAAADGYNILAEIKEVYNQFFNKSYLSGIIEELPADKSKMHSLYHILNSPYFSKNDITLLSDAVIYLEYFIMIINHYLLPELKDQLGISGFFRRIPLNSDEFVIKSFIYHAFPFNLDKLVSLTEELKQVNKRLIA